MMEDLQDKLGLTYLFIAHDISVVRHISDRIGVMYLGSMVELAESYELCSKPLHPYTQSLLAAVQIPDPELQNGNDGRNPKSDQSTFRLPVPYKMSALQ